MELKVEVTDASLSDIVDVAVDMYEETVTTTTLGDVIVKAMLDRLTKDPRWDALAERFWDTFEEQLRGALPGFAQDLVAKEVAKQLAATSQTAMVRGQQSTRAEAIVATEVTTQLRAQFTPLVERALDNLANDLRVLSGDALETFLKGSGGKR